ncbi:hypothetical protein GJ698_01965 [Pseudoduganella sp. FT26W]|uniref:Bacteriophage N4 adsorption protein A C-terminal domain-containing protein n=1 Tax=Duganella aquatilis TaxID=2666082 RepID=A0A844D3Y9_9BURK|nr:hypothetical protein [Duganella aquatilis]MRW82856.1 hypothetical protein [Duganella aquatilis]
MKQPTLHFSVLCCVMSALPAALAAAPAADQELSGEAWRQADLAYRAYAERDYASAIRHAKEAARLRPDVKRLQALIGYAEQAQQRRRQPSSGSAADVALLKKIEALAAEEQYEVAVALAEQGLRAPGTHTVLAARARQLRSQAAMQVAAKALEADAAGNTAAALATMRSASAFDPEAPQYRLMLIKLLLQNNDADGAEAAARTALAINSDDAMTQTYAAFLQQQKGQREQARTLYAKAIKGDELGDADLLNLRLIAADAALSAADSRSALDALAPLRDSNPEVRERRALAQSMAAAGADGFRPSLTAPQLKCVLNRFGPVCSLFAGARPSQQLAAEAYRLQGENQLQQALAMIDAAIRVGGASTELQAQRKQIFGIMAREQAAIAFKALAANDTDQATQALNKAIAYAPDVMSYRMMLIDIQVQNKDYAAGERMADEAMQIDADDINPRVMRGYLRQAQGKFDSARQDYRAALANPELRDSERLHVGLFVADALWAGGAAGESGALLDTLPSSDPQVRWRRRLVDASAALPALMPPTLDYRATPYDTVPSIHPSVYATDTLVAAIFRAMQRHDDEEAVSLSRLLVASAPDKQDFQRVLSIALTSAGETREARKVNQQLGASVPSLDFAYMAQRVKAPEVASPAFREIDQAGQLPERALRDAGYAAMDANERHSAIAYFKRAINASRDGDVPLEQQQLYDIRRTVEQLDRQWGVYASVSYRGSTPQSGPASGATGDSTQFGSEAYWRPSVLNRDGRYVDLYARLNATLHSEQQGIATGGASTLGAVGMRVKPLASQNVILAAERLVPIGARTDGDWLLRAAYSNGTGTDLVAGMSAWTMAQLYAEAGRYLHANSNYFTSEAQWGRSFRPAGAWPLNSVLTPHLVLAADYNQGFAQPRAIGAGAGLTYRYWFNEDRYTAPRAYFDLTLQYRVRVSGDDRAGGVVLRAVISR